MIEQFVRHILKCPVSWFLAAVLIFVLAPTADLAVSGWFYRSNEGFYEQRSGIMEFLRKGAPRIMIVFVAGTWLVWVTGWLRRKCYLGLNGRGMLYLGLTLAIGPGLVVETILKSYWGRARPRQIEEFGGDALFSLPFWVSDQCVSNCSFSSGHAAFAFWFTAYSFVVPVAWRSTLFFSGVLFGCLMGIVRIAQGAHFLSDIIFSGLVVIGINYLSYIVMLKKSCEPHD